MKGTLEFGKSNWSNRDCVIVSDVTFHGYKSKYEQKVFFQAHLDRLHSYIPQSWYNRIFINDSQRQYSLHFWQGSVKKIWFWLTNLNPYLYLNYDFNKRLNLKLHDKRNDKAFSFVIFALLWSNIPASSAYDVHVLQ